MADREQVLKALRACSPGDTIWCQMRVKGQCDYAGEHCMARLLSDAAELLEAQAPRVMMLGDLRDIGSVWELNTPPYLWMEVNPTYRWTRGFWVAWREIYDMIDGLHPTYDADNYLKTWCIWTFRPTDEQREAIPWEGVKS